MASRVSGKAERPREWRRRVMVPARVRSSAGWGDARILNVSSRGLMLHLRQQAERGSLVEIRRGCHTIVAHVVWRDGPRAGVHSDALLPLTELLSLSEAPSASADAAQPSPPDANPRSALGNAAYRERGRLLEFASLMIAGAALTLTLGSMVGESLAAPLTVVRAALGE